MIVLSSPSGEKTTLSKKIQQSDNTLKFQYLTPQEKARPNEVDGVDYHFVTEKNLKFT